MIRVGTAGWSYADWEGPVYPRSKPPGFHPLRYLADFVQCMEINSTFYAPTRASHAQRWLDCVREHPEFRFVAKLHGAFTHEAWPDDARLAEDAASVWLAGIQPLVDAGRLSAVLVQFPHSFRAAPPNWERLDRLEALFGHLRLAVELRHLSWFQPRALERLANLEMAQVVIDLPAADDHPPTDPPTTGPLGYLRLHGRNAKTWFARDAGRDDRYDYLYAPDEVGELVERSRRLAARHDETLVVTNNHFAGKALANALEILHGLSGEAVPAPAELVRAFPRLADKTRLLGQGSLFG